MRTGVGVSGLNLGSVPYRDRLPDLSESRFILL